MAPRFAGFSWLVGLLAGLGACGNPSNDVLSGGVTGAATGGTTGGNAAAGGSAGAGQGHGQGGGGNGSGGGVGGASGGSDMAGAGAVGGGGAGSVGGSGGAAMVGVFVAQGHEGRITRSCDDGLTFPYNHSADDQFRCFVDADHDCDHSELAGRGLAFGEGAFVATWGWGHPGKLQRSVNGQAWSDVMTETPTFADVAYGNGTFVACGNPTRVSHDGQAWEEGGKLSFDFNYRGIEFVPTAGGLFVVGGESGANRAISYSADGKAWQAASDRPDLCGEQLRGIAGSDSAMILVSAKGHVCRSTDGKTWTFAQVTERFTSPPLWTGDEFWVYSGAQLYKSADAMTWTSQAITPANIQIGALARSPGGTLVAANDGWQVWYEKQQFFRSTDGVSWSVLPPGSFTGSHPINFISFGYVPASAGCGAP
ncbi:MAG TPA: hypothetical protein VHB79_30305 [Polyangiaceae bacterium]|nr:hypothetical protein [Polyangiaceae bacterium]